MIPLLNAGYDPNSFSTGLIGFITVFELRADKGSTSATRAIGRRI